MNDNIKTAIQQIVADLFGQADTPIELTRPDPQFGDWTTNIALRLAKLVASPPRTVAESISTSLQERLGETYTITVAGPGFINIILPDSYFQRLLPTILKAGDSYGHNASLQGKMAVIEGTDPNPFKQLHIGHAYSNTIGEAISGLHEASGARVIRANYQGDIGMHVAKSIWGMRQILDGAELASIDEQQRSAFLGKAYAAGATAFENDEGAQSEMKELNKQLYTKDPSIQTEYQTGRQWSLDYFESQYARLETRFDAYYFEQFTGEAGMKLINAHRDIFEKSDGALVYNGEQDGLHTRVFVNSQGFPTYEAKDLGLAAMKERDYSPDISITFTGSEIIEYFKVIKAVLAKINPEWAQKITHVTHGMVRLPEGKMSSRTGDVITAEWLLDTTEALVAEQTPDGPSTIANSLGAIKYAFLKQRIGGDIAFDINESISLEGNSGPYIQYAHARASRVISKLGAIEPSQPTDLTADERSMIALLEQLPETLLQARVELSPHVVCTYLYEVAQQFNRFYENNRVIDDPRRHIRAQIVQATAITLNNGLRTLNIPAPEKM